MIYLMLSTVVLVYLLIGEYRTRKRLERMNAKALIQIAELRDTRDALEQSLEAHRKNFVCNYSPKAEEWPDEIKL